MSRRLFRSLLAAVGLAGFTMGALPAPAQAQCQPAAAKNMCVNPCNPCGAKIACPCNPCAAKNPCNPCNPCSPCNPCAATNPCNPCAAN